MPLKTAPYLAQSEHWPQSGKVILAQYDATSVTVYQAYRPVIGHFAAQYGYFGDEFKLSRMTWIKPNFLWMMYRSGWGRKEGQNVVLAVQILRSAFDEILSQAVHSKYIPGIYPDPQSWKRALRESDVRLQWDPDYSPSGSRVQRRAIQLGLRGETASKYSREWIVHIEDISEFVTEQRQHAMSGQYERLLTPIEQPYSVTIPETARRLGIKF